MNQGSDSIVVSNLFGALQQDNEVYRQDCLSINKSLELKLNNFKSEVRAKGAEVAELKEGHRKLKIQVMKKEAKIEHLENDLSELKKENKELRLQVVKKDATIELLEKDMKDVKIELLNVKKDFDQFKAMLFQMISSTSYRTEAQGEF